MIAPCQKIAKSGSPTSYAASCVWQSLRRGYYWNMALWHLRTNTFSIPVARPRPVGGIVANPALHPTY